MAEEYDIGEAFRRIEDELIASMKRNLSHHIKLEEDEGISYTMWQVEQMAALQRFQQENAKNFPQRFSEINAEFETVLRDMHEAGGFEQEKKILSAIKRGWVSTNGEETMQGTFFGKNSRKLDALINSTMNDMERAETAVLRLVNDQYRKIIYNAQVYYNTGAGTLAQCVDMASHDFLAAGINCVEYKNGARVGIDSYAEMALRTASTRAYLQGEAEMRDGWGINTVKVMSRGNACHKCMQWVGRVYYDDVWSDVPPPPPGERKYPLLSEAIEGGLYHPNCKDTHSTYFEGLDDEPKKPTQKDADRAAGAYNAERKKRYAQRQARKYERLEAGSVDGENRRKYKEKEKEWEKTGWQEDAKKPGFVPVKTAKEMDVSQKGVSNIGKIDINKFSRVAENITTDEVIITDERIQHINNHHPGDYETILPFLSDAIASPDYILKDRKNTGLVLKMIEANGMRIQVIIRVHTIADPSEHKNSIISAWRIGRKRWDSYVKNKKILYKAE